MTIAKLIKAVTANRATTWWAASALTAVLFAAAIFSAVGAGVAPVALAAEERLLRLNGASLIQYADSDASILSDLQVQIDQTEAEIEFAAAFAGVVRLFSPSVSWLPIVNQEIDATALQVERVQQDLQTASTVLEASAQLLNVYQNAQAALVTPNAGPIILQLKRQAFNSQKSFSISINRLRDAKQERQRSSIILQVPRMRGLTSKLGELEDQMLTASVVGYETSGLMTDLLEVADAMQPLLTQFTSNDDESIRFSLEDVEASLERATKYADSAKTKANAIVDIANDTGYGNQYLSKVDTLHAILDAFIIVSDSASVGLKTLSPAMRALENTEGGLLRNGGLVDVFDTVASNRTEIENAVGRLAKAEKLLGDASNGGGGIPVSGLMRVSEMVADLRTGLGFISDVAPIASEIIAADSVKKYLILGQSADEIRGTGGFVSSVWLVTFQDGGLESIEYFDAVRVDDWDRLEFYPTAPEGLETHMNGQVWLLRDVSWDPDFPTTAKSAEDLFRLGQRQQVDGVIAINQWTLLKLVDALGEIPAPDGGDPINSRNLLSVLEQGTDVYGRAYMDLVMQGALDRLDEPMSMPDLMRMASALLNTLKTNDTLIFLNSPEAQAVVEARDWGGSVSQTSHDYLYVVDSNVGWSKVDRNIQRDIAYNVDLSRETRPRASLTLGYSNHSAPGSPPCEPQWLNRGMDYSQLKNACYWDYFRVYMPQESRLLNATLLPLPTQSVSVETGASLPGEDTGAISSSHDKMVFSGLTVIGAGERNEVNLVYDLPRSVTSVVDDGLLYQLFIQKQPGVLERNVMIEVVPPNGYTYATSSLEPFQVSESRINFSFDLTRNSLLEIRFTSDVDDPA